MSDWSNFNHEAFLDIGKHPLWSHSVIVPTRSCDEMYRIVKSAILVGKLGCVFAGPTFSGKSDGAEYTRRMLNQQIPTLRTYLHNVHYEQRWVERVFLRSLLSTTGHKANNGKEEDLHKRLVHQLVDDARQCVLNRVVLFIDGADQLLPDELVKLDRIYADVQHEGVLMMVVLVGAGPAVHVLLKNAAMKPGTDLLPCIAENLHQFRSLYDFDDIRALFNTIDRIEHPEGSGKTWTSFFLPLACKGGFCLASQVQDFVDGVVGTTRSSKSDTLDISIRAIFLAIRYFFLEARQCDASCISLPGTIWQEAVQSGLMDAAVSRMNSLRGVRHDFDL